MKIKLCICLFILFFLLSMSFKPHKAFATNDLTTLSIEELMNVVVDIVVTASKYEQKVTDAPSSISIITADEIRKYGHRDFAEILRSVRGFYSTYDRNYKYLGVRGFGLPSDYNNRILVLIDGNKINDNIYDSVGVGPVFNLDIDTIKRIEVVRGPGSSLYGKSAFFGVINVITKKGEDYNGFEVSAEAGTFDRYKTSVKYGKRYQNGLEIALSGTYLDSEGDDSLFFKEFDDPETNNGIAENQNYDREKKLYASIIYDDFTLTGGYIYTKLGVPTAPWETIFNHDLFTVEEQYWLGLKYEHTYDGDLTVLARVNYSEYNYYGLYPYEGDPEFEEPPVVINDDSADGRWLNAELHITKPIMEKHKLTLGSETQINFEERQRSVFLGVTDWGVLDDSRDTSSWAVFLQDEYTYSDNFIISAGVRYDHFESFGGTTNPRIGVIYKPDPASAIKAIYGRAFRAPNAYEFYFDDDHATTIKNLELQPETINTYELIYEKYFATNYRMSAGGFYYEIDDLIQQTEDLDEICDFGDPCLVFQNLSQVTAKGVEFEIEGKWDTGLHGRVSYTFQETNNEETDDEMINSPKHMLKLNVSIPLVRERFYLSLEEQYTAKRKTLTDEYVDEFFITNLTLLSQNLLNNLDASFSVYNLFNKKYSDPGAGEHTMDAIEQNGREFRLKLTYMF